jgi:hypothetical protein
VSSSDPRRKLIAAVPDASLNLLAKRIEGKASAEIAELIRAVLVEVREVDVLDLWKPREAALTYWILMLTGINQAEEMRIATDLLSWQAFFAKDSARVVCLQSSERDAFRCCSARFDVHDCPTLIVSDRPDMVPHLKVQAGLLRTLAAQDGELQRFLSRLHALAENGRTLAQLRDLMAAESFWRGLKVLYKEVKGLVSISINPSG